ncbi:hypothetical protein LZC95_22105 [Pendulispora brunnea]|uniref:Uncharacterized protein n=1 Tax=Pendulispora brunnea TaxID=2905690 RepID=A0ABZ2KR28_9BACT
MKSKSRFFATLAIASILSTMALATTAPDASALPKRDQCIKACMDKQEGAVKKCQGGDCRKDCPPEDKKPSEACAACMKPCIMPKIKEMNECVQKCPS